MNNAQNIVKLTDEYIAWQRLLTTPNLPQRLQDALPSPWEYESITYRVPEPVRAAVGRALAVMVSGFDYECPPEDKTHSINPVWLWEQVGILLVEKPPHEIHVDGTPRYPEPTRVLHVSTSFADDGIQFASLVCEQRELATDEESQAAFAQCFDFNENLYLNALGIFDGEDYYETMEAWETGKSSGWARVSFANIVRLLDKAGELKDSLHE